MLCSNTLIKKEDFNNAMRRHMIRMFDYKRSDNYDCDNCKHLACTEVRAALFHSQCNPNEKATGMTPRGFPTKGQRDRVDANEFCVKDVAIEHLKERQKCADKADRYVDYIFDRCKTDTAPFAAGRQRKVKTFTEIL